MLKMNNANKKASKKDLNLYVEGSLKVFQFIKTYVDSERVKRHNKNLDELQTQIAELTAEKDTLEQTINFDTELVEMREVEIEDLNSEIRVLKNRAKSDRAFFYSKEFKVQDTQKTAELFALKQDTEKLKKEVSINQARFNELERIMAKKEKELNNATLDADDSLENHLINKIARRKQNENSRVVVNGKHRLAKSQVDQDAIDHLIDLFVNDIKPVFDDERLNIQYDGSLIICTYNNLKIFVDFANDIFYLANKEDGMEQAYAIGKVDEFHSNLKTLEWSNDKRQENVLNQLGVLKHALKTFLVIGTLELPETNDFEELEFSKNENVYELEPQLQ